MITVHASTITAVPTDNGLGAILPTECIITQEINGEYELELTHPRDEYGKWERLAVNNLIYAPTPDGTQLFRIYRVKKQLDGTVKVNARHVFYDLMDNVVESVAFAAKTGTEAVQGILAATQFATTFTGASDIATAQNASYALTNPVACLIGGDNSVIDIWGGELARDNFSVAINTRLGADNGRRVAYRKNLTGADAQEDASKVVTRIMPTGLNADDTILYLDPSKYVDSAHISDYPHPRIQRAHFTDVKVGVAKDGVVTYPTVADARTELDARADALLAAGCDVPEVSIDVEFAELGDSEEYKAYIQLATVQLGDTVTVEHEDLDIDLSLRVVSYEWDALLERHNKIRLGDQRPNIGKSVVDIGVDLSALKNDTSTIKVGEAYNAVKINHTDGFVATATISGIVVEVKMNATDGISITADDKKVFGVASDGRIFAQSISNVENTGWYAEMGFVNGGIDQQGLSLSSTTTPRYLQITEVDGTVLFLDSNFKTRISISPSGEMSLYDSSDNVMFWCNEASNFCQLHTPSTTDNAVGVDATGAYKIKNGVKTYL